MPEIGVQEIEIPVRITLKSDQALDATIFPLPSHKNDAPLDTLAGFLNQRRGDFFVTRLSDGSEMILSLSNCAVFELTNDSINLLHAVHPLMAKLDLTCNPDLVVSYAPVVLTLKTSRAVRGDLWFYDFEPEDERNVISGLNREARYVCIHGERSIFFVQRTMILKAQLNQNEMTGDFQSQTHPDHVTNRSGLVDVTMFHPPGARREDLEDHMHFKEPEPVPQLRPPQAPLRGAFPFAPKSAVTPPKKPRDPDEPLGVDERFWY